jgi:hypothetical protein
MDIQDLGEIMDIQDLGEIMDIQDLGEIIFVRNDAPIALPARSKAWVCGLSLCGECGFESRRGHGYLRLMSVVCCQVEVSAVG